MAINTKAVMNKKRLIFFGIALLVLFFVTRKVIKMVSAFNERTAYSKTQEQEYLALFPKSKQQFLFNVWNYNSKKRNQFSLFDYGTERKYSLLIYKIKAMSPFILDSIRFPRRDQVDVDGMYMGITQRISRFNYKPGTPEEARSISISYTGDSLRKVATNDTIVAYYLSFHKFAISYNGTDNIDIYGQPNTIERALPLSFLFLKRNNAVYLIISTVNNDTDSMPPNFLYKLLSSEG